MAGTIAVAETAEASRRLLVPEAWAMAYSRTHGVFRRWRRSGRSRT
ncbi:hypothetical protein NKH18_50910 [Streptomyces sp. M10(2022)]